LNLPQYGVSGNFNRGFQKADFKGHSFHSGKIEALDLVLPHSHAAASRPTNPVLINGILAILLLVGLPISLCNRFFAPTPR
jgi:hypothetical protein